MKLCGIGELSGSLATVTHARLRMEQGDIDGARRILLAVLVRDSGDAAATALMERLVEASSRTREEPADEVAEPPVPGDSSALAARVREVLGVDRTALHRRLVEGLEAWLQQIVATRGERNAR